MKLVFAIAQSTESSMDELMKESETHNDILFMGFHDSYRNLTLKSLLSLRWLSHHCANASFFVKVDDDQFVFIPQLLLDLRPFDNRRNLILGNYNDHSQAFHSNLNGKWDIPKEVFPFESFPPYVSGPLYAMTSDVASTISSSAPYVFPVHLEDVFVTGIIPKVMNIQHAILSGFGDIRSFKPSACTMTLFELVAMELENDSEKLELWQDFLDANKTASKLCLRETQRRSLVRWNHNASHTL
ncbi:hypothetical protein CAPTEDRAFT_145557 [Capitella teleta]|uniref:Hexosyltransferase n=1 Tax=Capitella teleta TaxID=283909 RepID=R7UHU9_CAPTE|nr:hypothetical protein CAPTEDRAFT_145557 [Capitella teleta]|eukprot:ELU05658.1 hypothetical protein CAPTEDRAFT_145557 [Capitella teleta]